MRFILYIRFFPNYYHPIYYTSGESLIITQSGVPLDKFVDKRTCIIHIARPAARFCESCDRPFCREDLVEYYSGNFVSYAFLGAKREYTKSYLCKACERSKRVKSVSVASVILIIFLLGILAIAFGSPRS